MSEKIDGSRMVSILLRVEFNVKVSCPNHVFMLQERFELCKSGREVCLRRGPTSLWLSTYFRRCPVGRSRDRG